MRNYGCQINIFVADVNNAVVVVNRLFIDIYNLLIMIKNYVNHLCRHAKTQKPDIFGAIFGHFSEIQALKT